VQSSPLVSGSTVVVVGERGTVAAFSLPGLRPAWRQATRDLGTTTAAIARGRLFVAGEQGIVVAFDLANGQQLWQQALQVEAHGITTAGDRGVVLGAAKRQFHLDVATGESLRTFVASEGEWARGATVVGERLLVPLRDGGIDVFDLASSARLYRLESQKRARALPCGTGALVPTNDRTLHWFAGFR
jgi:outer membrane protein assembly factor BamB